MREMFPFGRQWPLAVAANLACCLEAAAPKAGNVHPGQSFSDMNFAHFLASASVLQDCLADLYSSSVGNLVLNLTQATRRMVGCNTNLGTILLFAPLLRAAAQYPDLSLPQAVSRVLATLTAEDSHDVYAAIRVAQPGGLGKQSENDIADSAPADLLLAMKQAAERDAVARQFANGFEDVFRRMRPKFDSYLFHGCELADAICRLQVDWLASEDDSLVVRKCGAEVAGQVRNRAAKVRDEANSWSEAITRLDSYRAFDEFLRADGHQRNPGTTADLIAATLLTKLIQ